jgi:hypothetical protein
MTRSDFSHFFIVTKVTFFEPRQANRFPVTHSARVCFFDRRASSVLVLACNFSMIRLT